MQSLKTIALKTRDLKSVSIKYVIYYYLGAKAINVYNIDIFLCSDRISFRGDLTLLGNLLRLALRLHWFVFL